MGIRFQTYYKTAFSFNISFNFDDISEKEGLGTLWK